MTRPRILVVGDAMLDQYWSGSVDRISPEAPVPILRVESVEARAGGAANVAANLAAMGAEVRLVAPIADDADGRELRSVLERVGVDVAPTPAARTTVKLRALGPRGHQMMRLDFEGSCDPIPPGAEDAFPHDALVVSDYGKGAIGPRTLAAAGARLFVDGGKAKDLGIYAQRAELLKMNLEEARSHALRSSDVDWRNLVVTAAEAPTCASTSRGSFFVPVPAAVKVADVSGAGDTFMAALVFYTLRGLDLRRAIETAHFAARIAVQRRGTAIVSARDMLEEGSE